MSSDDYEKSKRSVMAEKVAILTLQGVGIKEIHKQISQEDDPDITRAKVVALKNHPRFHEVITKGELSKIESAIREAKLGFARLTTRAMEKIEDLIEDGNLGAIQLVFKCIGMLDLKPEDTKQAQSITVVLPTMDAPKEVKEINAEVKSTRIKSFKES